MKKWLALLFCCAVVATLSIGALWPASTPGGVASAADTPAAPAKSAADVGALGRIEPLNGIYELQVPSGLFPARVAKLLVEEGDQVKQGDVVAIIDNMQTLSSDVAQSRSEAVSRQADFEQAKRDYDRYKVLAAQGVIPQDTLDQAESRLKDAEGQLGASRADIQTRATQLSRTDIIAPVDGTILKVRARDGECAPWDKGVLAMGMTGHMMAVAEVYEDDILRVRPGQRAEIASTALPGPLSGTVEHIGNMVEEPTDYSPDPAKNTQSRVVKVRIRLDDSKPVERLTGLLVHVVIKTGN